MIPFDSHTLLVLVTVGFLVIPVMVWLILPGQDGLAKSMWCLGGVMAGTGLTLLILRPYLPVLLSFHLANTLIMGYFVCASHSLRITLGRSGPRAPWVHWCLHLLLALLFYSALYAWTSDAQRGALFRLGLGAAGVYTAWWAWRLHRGTGSPNAAAIAVAYALVGVALLGHSLWTVLFFALPGPFVDAWNVRPLLLMVLVMMVVAAWCYVGMALDLAAMERLQSLQAQQAARQTELLGTQLTHLDRRGRMAIVSGSLAHELNQPLTAATMNAQLAQRLWAMEPVASPMLMDLLDQIESGVERTVRILQRIRGGKEAIAQHQERVDLQALLEQALVQMAPDLARAGVQLMHTRSPQAVWCLGDALGLSQVVVNLLRNAQQAMQHQPEGARHLWVRCALQQGQALLVVRDSGPGMPASILAQWGQPFAGTRSEGMGLGLAISREIVTRHQGQLLLVNLPHGGLEATVAMPALEGAAA